MSGEQPGKENVVLPNPGHWKATATSATKMVGAASSNLDAFQSNADKRNRMHQTKKDLEGLVRLVLVHKQNHREQRQAPAITDGDSVEDISRCKTTLSKLKKVLTKLMRAIGSYSSHQDAQEKIDMIKSLCSLMTVLLDGSVCPHSMAFFQDGNASVVLPMTFYMFPFFMEKELHPVHNEVFQMISKFMLLLRQSDLNAYVHVVDGMAVLLDDLRSIQEEEILLMNDLDGCTDFTTGPQDPVLLYAFGDAAIHIYSENSAIDSIDAESIMPPCCDKLNQTSTNLSNESLAGRLNTQPIFQLFFRSQSLLLQQWVIRLCTQCVRHSTQFMLGHATLHRVSDLVVEEIEAMINSHHETMQSTPYVDVLQAAIELAGEICKTSATPNYHYGRCVELLLKCLCILNGKVVDATSKCLISLLRDLHHVYRHDMLLDTTWPTFVDVMKVLFEKDASPSISAQLALLGFLNVFIPEEPLATLRYVVQIFSTGSFKSSQALMNLLAKCIRQLFSHSMYGPSILRQCMESMRPSEAVCHTQGREDSRPWKRRKKHSLGINIELVSADECYVPLVGPTLSFDTFNVKDDVIFICDTMVQQCFLQEPPDLVAFRFGLEVFLPFCSKRSESSSWLLSPVVRQLEKMSTLSRSELMKHVDVLLILLVYSSAEEFGKVGSQIVEAATVLFDDPKEVIEMFSLTQHQHWVRVQSKWTSRLLNPLEQRTLILEDVLGLPIGLRSLILLAWMFRIQLPKKYASWKETPFMDILMIQMCEDKSPDVQITTLSILPIVVNAMAYNSNSAFRSVLIMIVERLGDISNSTNPLDPGVFEQLLITAAELACLTRHVNGYKLEMDEESFWVSSLFCLPCAMCLGERCSDDHVEQSVELSSHFEIFLTKWKQASTNRQMTCGIRLTFSILRHIDIPEEQMKRWRLSLVEFRDLFFSKNLETVADMASFAGFLLHRKCVQSISVNAQISYKVVRFPILDAIFQQPTNELNFNECIKFFDHLLGNMIANKSHQPAIIQALGQIGAACTTQQTSAESTSSLELDLLLWCLFSLLKIWIRPLKMGSLAYDQICMILGAHSTSWKDLCVQFPEKVYPPLIYECLNAPNTSLSSNPAAKFVELFIGSQVNIEVFLEASAPYVLPRFVIQKERILLESYTGLYYQLEPEVLQRKQMNHLKDNEIRLEDFVEKLLLRYTEFVVKEMIIHQVQYAPTESQSFEIWNFLLGYMPPNSTVCDVIRHSPHRLLNAVAWDFAGAKRKVARKAFIEISRYLQQDVPEDSRSPSLMPTDGESESLSQNELIPRKYFLALMTDLSQKVMSRRKTIKYRQRALVCIEQLILLFGKNGLDQFVPKVMATLKLALQEEQLCDVACDALRTFTKMLSMKTLANNISSIVVSLIPCLGVARETSEGNGAISVRECHEASAFPDLASKTHSCQGKEMTTDEIIRSRAYVKNVAIDIMNYIFVECRKDLKHTFGKFPFIPTIPELDGIHAILLQDVGDPNSVDLSTQISEMTKILQHWNASVREMALVHLRELLVAKAIGLQDLIMGDSQVSLVITNLVHEILLLCRTESEDSILLLCGECLGALGAIDCTRMPLERFYGSASVHRQELSTKDLALKLIEEDLVRELRAAPENTDSVAFTIQELLRFLASFSDASTSKSMEIKSSRRPSQPMPIWLQKRFESKLLLDVIEPYWSTNYTVAGKPSHDRHSCQFDTFYDGTSTYETWLISWTKHLIDQSQFAEKAVFHACRTVISSCPSIAYFLLPYLVQNVLNSGKPEDYDGIKREVLTVLGNRDVAYEYMESNSNSSLRGGVSSESDGFRSGGGGGGGRGHNRHHQCTQALFSMLDALNEWLHRAYRRDKRNASSSSVNGSGQVPMTMQVQSSDDQEKEVVEEFLKDIPSRSLAETAFQVKAYARSLQYFEVYCRENGASPVPIYNNGSIQAKRGGRPDIHVAKISKSDISYLQQIYSYIDEPDGLVGLAALRRLRNAQEAQLRAPSREDLMMHPLSAHAQPSVPIEEWDGSARIAGGDLMSRIIDHEHLGQWEEALMCYEQVLQNIDLRGIIPFHSGLIPLGSVDSHQVYQGEEELQQSKAIIYTGIIRCMVKLGRFEGSLQQIEGILNHYPPALSAVYPLALECSWRLSRWDFLSEMVHKYQKIGKDNSSGHFARVLLSIHEKDSTRMISTLREARLSLMGPLAAASVESYQRSYPLLQKLHILHEVEQGFLAIVKASRITDDETSESENSEALKSQVVAVYSKQCPWDSRMKLVSSSLDFQEELFALRRVILQELGLHDMIGANWLQYAKTARRLGHFKTAVSAVMQAEAFNVVNAHMENAKLLFCQGNIHDALQLLEPVNVNLQELVQQSKTSISNSNINTRFQQAKILLLTTNWLQQARQKQGKEVIERYKAVVQLNNHSEKSYFYLARYYEQLLKSLSTAEDIDESSSMVASSHALTHEYLIAILENYVHALKYGTKFLYQSLPRFLTLWFEYGETLYFSSKKASTSSKTQAQRSMVLQSSREDNLLTEIDRIVQQAIQTLPIYEWYACFPQVASRICHPNPSIVEGVKQIMILVLSTFPSQALWFLLGLSNSKNSQRRLRANEIVSTAQKNLHNKRWIEQAESLNEGMKLVDQLIKLAGMDNNGQKKISFKIPRIRCKILVPITEMLTVTLPFNGQSVSNSSSLPPLSEGGPPGCYRVFPSNMIHISEFSEKIEVLASKERPKKIAIVGSDGHTYTFLCKRESHGDLRKDSRMMEFNTMINKLLQRNPEGRKRKLRLRTYSVICLNEESGLMEWVSHTKTMRSLVSQIYKTEKGFLQPVRLTKEIKDTFLAMQSKFADDIPSMVDFYRTRILPLPVFQPRFHQWFLNAFSDPTEWFEARVAFARSAAAWSMVGHIVGLGDRHGENILIDCTTGECVHVDFDCLFDKGLKLARPEIVPFRLTPNMVDALGLTGYEGVYREVCEVVLSLLRNHKETLLSVLESFIHDPLVEWGRMGKTQRSSGGGSLGSMGGKNGRNGGNEDAKHILRKIDARLNGVYNLGEFSIDLPSSRRKNEDGRIKEKDVLPLSVQGQVERLIQEATSDGNLAQMYIGWMPFL